LHWNSAAKGLGNIEEDKIKIDSDLTEPLPKFKPAEEDWAIKLLNLMSRSKFLTRYFILNNALFLPARQLAIAVRRVRSLAKEVSSKE